MWLSHKAIYENLCGARCDGRGRCWEHRGRAERAATDHGSDDLVAGNDWGLGNIDIPVEQVHEELVGSRVGICKLNRAQNTGTLYLHRPHFQIMSLGGGLPRVADARWRGLEPRHRQQPGAELPWRSRDRLPGRAAR